MKNMSPIRYLGVVTLPGHLRGDSCSWKVWSRRRWNCKDFGCDGSRATSSDWPQNWPPTGGMRRVVGGASSEAPIETRGGSDAFGMFRCGGSLWTLVYAPRRVQCARCRGVHVEALPWAVGQQRFTRALLVTIATWTRVLLPRQDPRPRRDSDQQRFTRALLVTIATWTRVLPWQQVARLFGCAWGTVERAVEAAVAYGLTHRDLTGVTHIGIDEISRKKGHVYVTNVYDLARKRLLWSGEGRSQATLAAFFDFLGPARTAALDGVCCDMWQPYIDVIKAPGAPGRAGLRQVPHRESSHAGRRPGPP